MTRVYLVRHATHALVGKVLAGRMAGVHLSEAGRVEAIALASYFAKADVGSIWSSPLDRCRETAAPIADRFGLDVAAAPALDELDCGDWTGKSFDDLHDDGRWREWNAERGRTVVPGGESIGSVRDRVMALVDRFAAEAGRPAILVTHSDVIKVVLLTLLRAPLDLHDRLAIDPASITTLDLWPGGGKIVRSNQTVAA